MLVSRACLDRVLDWKAPVMCFWRETVLALVSVACALRLVRDGHLFHVAVVCALGLVALGSMSLMTIRHRCFQHALRWRLSSRVSGIAGCDFDHPKLSQVADAAEAVLRARTWIPADLRPRFGSLCGSVAELLVRAERQTTIARSYHASTLAVTKHGEPAEANDLRWIDDETESTAMCLQRVAAYIVQLGASRYNALEGDRNRWQETLVPLEEELCALADGYSATMEGEKL